MPGPPIWAAPGEAIVRTELDDPRWVGSTRLYFPQDLGVGALARTSTRLLVDGGTLFISLRLAGDLGVTSDDSAWVGVGKGPTEAALASDDDDYVLIKVAVESGSQATAGAATLSAWASNTGDLSGAGWQPLFVTPWLELAHIWDAPDATNAWAVNLKVDLDALGVGAEGRLFLGSFADITFGQAWVSFWPPGSVALLQNDADLTTAQVIPDDWGTMTFGSTALPCMDGIRLTEAELGVGPSPDDVANVPGSSDSSDNDYFATPNWDDFDHPQDAVRASFRIADWDVGPAARSQALWPYFSGLVESDAGGELHRSCPVGTALCGALTDKDAEQCFLVTLQAGNAELAEVLKFAQDSAYRCITMGETPGGSGGEGGGGAGDGGAGDGSAGDGSAGNGNAGDGSAGDGNAGDGSAGDGSAGDGASSGQGGTSGTSGAPGSSGTGAGGTSGGARAADRSDDDGGCACGLVGAAGRPLRPWLITGIAALGLWLRRRATRRPS